MKIKDAIPENTLTEKAKNLYALFNGRQRVLDASKSKILQIKIEGTGFSGKVADHSNLEILTSKQMLQRLSVALYTNYIFFESSKKNH